MVGRSETSDVQVQGGGGGVCGSTRGGLSGKASYGDDARTHYDKEVKSVTRFFARRVSRLQLSSLNPSR